MLLARSPVYAAFGASFVFAVWFVKPILITNSSTNENIVGMYDDVGYIRHAIQMNCRTTALYKNLGWVDDPLDGKFYPDRAEELARKFAQAASLNNAKFVVDVGFGYGDQDMLFVNEFNVQQILGINLTPRDVYVARARVAASGLQDRIRFEVGDAVDLSMVDDSTADRVIALESAFHFNTRDLFFREAFRALRSGGRIALADIIVKDQASLVPMARAYQTMQPEANAYPPDEYKARLAAAGFQNIVIQDITSHIYAWKGMVRHPQPLLDLFNISGVPPGKTFDPYDPFPYDESLHWGQVYIIATADKL